MTNEKEIRDLYTYALSIFFNDDKLVMWWMGRPNKWMGNEKPNSLIATETGRAIIKNTLKRYDNL